MSALDDEALGSIDEPEALSEVRSCDRAAVAALLANAAAPDDASPLTVRDLVHGSLRSNAAADGADQRALAYLRPPPSELELDGLPRMALPSPQDALDMALSDVLEERRSDHNFGAGGLRLEVLSTLLHHAAGIKAEREGYNLRRFPVHRAPSAGGLAPWDVLFVANDVPGLDQGLYAYDPRVHGLAQLDRGNMRGKLVELTIFAQWIFYAPVAMLLVTNLDRVEWKYGTRGYRFAHVDLGILTQNLYLVATALGLTTCAVAAFDDDAMTAFARLDGRRRFVSLLFACGPPALA